MQRNKDNRDSLQKLESIKEYLRGYLRAKDVHEGSYKAHELEEAMINGILLGNPELTFEIPLLSIAPLSRRSILEFETNTES